MNENIISLLADYIYFVNIFFIITIIFVERRKPVYSLFWITILTFTSYLGFVIYLMFGLSFRKKRITKKFYKRSLFRRVFEERREETKRLEPWKQLINYFEYTGKSRLTFSNAVKIYIHGEELFKDIARDIRRAKTFIHLEYFIFQYDETGKKIGELLMAKAREGIEVKLIIDGVGSRKIPKAFIREMKSSGIELETFFPLYLPIIHLRVNYRTHRKIIIVDGRTAYTGGFNIGEEYLGRGPLGYWRDTHVRLHGSIIKELQKEFLSSWHFTKEQRLFRRKRKELPPVKLKRYFPTVRTRGKCPIQVVGSAPDYDFRLIRDGFLRIISNAKKYIYIHTPYFIPDDSTYEALKLASLSGVKVKIIIPDKPDHIMVYWASLSYVGELMNFGVDFYTYNNGFLHSKMIVSDDSVATMGSSNFDHRSFYQNFEINCFFYDERVVHQLKKAFIEDLKVSSKISSERYEQRRIMVKIKESISRLFSPIL